MTVFHRLSTPLTRAWAINRDARHKLAAWLARTYAKTGVAVCTDTLSVVAWVNPLAQIKFATPPFQRVERHQCANNPSWQDCECRRWFDPESGGPWGKRETPGHHPLCIFDPGAKRRWKELEPPSQSPASLQGESVAAPKEMEVQDPAKSVDILVFDGCPHLEVAIERVRDAVNRSRVTAEVRVVRIEDEVQAKELRFLGSPTVRVAGVDVEPAAAMRGDYAMQCRVYSVDGRFEGAPPTEWIETALRARVEASRAS